MLETFPLSDSKHAYKSDRSTDTALYYLSSILEKTLNHKEIALAVFLDERASLIGFLLYLNLGLSGGEILMILSYILSKIFCHVDTSIRLLVLMI